MNKILSWDYAEEIITWCMENLKEDDWEVKIASMGPVRYAFTLRSDRAITMFSLRWAEYA